MLNDDNRFRYEVEDYLIEHNIPILNNHFVADEYLLVMLEHVVNDCELEDGERYDLASGEIHQLFSSIKI